MRNLALTILAAAMVGCPPAPPAAPAPSADNQYQVTIYEYKFHPPRLVVPVGTRVTWVNRDHARHTATSAAAVEPFDSRDIRMQTTFSHTFTKVGTYPYLCIPHPGMKGMIVVE